MRVIQEKVRFYSEQPLIWICVGLTIVFVLSVMITLNSGKGEVYHDKNSTSPASQVGQSARFVK